MPKYSKNRVNKEAERIFEDEVRRIARELWPGAEYDGLGSNLIGGRGAPMQG